MFDDVASLLDAHGLAGVDAISFPHTGFSGATLTRLVRGDGRAYVLKRMSIEHDWIMRATDDVACREAVVADARVDLGAGIRTPAVGAARDGGEYALLMRDIGDHLLPQGTITESQLQAIVAGMSSLHERPMPDRLPWCDLTRRLTLLTPDGARIAAEYGVPVARDILDGWRLFDEHATAGARGIVRALIADPAPLVRALERSPAAFLHGDLKFDNIGLDDGGRMWLIDWAMPLVAAPAVDLGWFLAINSRRLPVPLDDLMLQYADATGMTADLRARHDALTVLCGLLLRGWRKALDAAAGEPAELRWWCERAEDASWVLAE